MRVAVTTLGCKVNQCESAGLTEDIAGLGHVVVPFREAADVYVVNTCTVTARTDYQSRQLIRQAHRRNPEAAIIVTGCYAQVAPEALAGLPGVVLVAGTAEKRAIPAILGHFSPSNKAIRVSDLRRCPVFGNPAVSRFAGHTRAFLKIQDGCDAFCSYCIVPYARGKSRSLPVDDVLAGAARLSGSGHREVVLTGIHLGVYGLDLTPPTDLLSVVKRIEETAGLSRLRLSSIEPREVTEGLIEHMRHSKTLCRHLHIPLQSGCDRILGLMGRDYGASFFEALVSRVLSVLPEAAVGVDVMAGFPGETDEEFAQTLGFLERLPAAYLHVFPYSERPGTPAAGMPGKVPETVKSQRGKALRALDEKKRRLFAERLIGKTVTVLVEDRRDGATGLLKGFSGNYVPVLVSGGDCTLAGTEAAVLLTGIRNGKVFGRIL